AVTTGELRGLRRRALELVDHLAFGELDLADRDRETELLGHDLDGHLSAADLACEGMVAAIAALRRIGKAQQETLVAAGQRLQPYVALGRVCGRLARDVADRRLGI